MKAIMIMFDSLNRHMLPNYGCDWVKAPNFERLEKNAVVFDKCYAGSLPCMPARRELHTGRYNFLHNSWGPMQPYDDSMPKILSENGVFTHLTSDHYHYWEEGGANYHTKYNTFNIARGQEGDNWKAEVKDPDLSGIYGTKLRNDEINRKYMDGEEKQPQALTFKNGIEFIKTNKDQDDWFLHIETFDPHEPYFTQQNYQDLYPHEYDGDRFDWPPYGSALKHKDKIKHIRYMNAALVSMCDKYLGKVLDMMDEYDMWDDTMLIVNTDHGFLLGEHDYMGKTSTPCWNEVVHTPFFVWDPRTGKKNERNDCLVQTIDIPATLLDYFNVELPKDMQGKPLKETIESKKEIRDCALFGIHGGQVGCTDGDYVYMRASVNEDNQPLYEYTLMPSRMKKAFTLEELEGIEIAEPFKFTKGCRNLKVKTEKSSVRGWYNSNKFGNLLYDLKKDPKQEKPIEDKNVEKHMIDLMKKKMQENDAPKEQYKRLGIK